MRKFLTTFLGCATIGCASQQPAVDAVPDLQRTFLTHEELNALMSETRTLRVSGYAGRGTGTYQKDGTAGIHLDNGPTLFGNWRIEGNRICVTYPQTGRGCYHVQKTGASTYSLFLNGGSANVVWEILK